jgi:hypothetical protein
LKTVAHAIVASAEMLICARYEFPGWIAVEGAARHEAPPSSLRQTLPS